jgi:hypothetical protein
VSCVFGTKAAELLVLNPPGLLLLVLGHRIVPTLALRTLQRDNVSHCSTLFFIVVLIELATGIEPVTSSLPRKCSTN